MIHAPPILLGRRGELRLGVQQGVYDGGQLGGGGQGQAVHHHDTQEHHHVPLCWMVRQGVVLITGKRFSFPKIPYNPLA